MKAFEKVGFRSNTKTEQLFKPFSVSALNDVKGLHDSGTSLRDSIISFLLIIFSKIISLFSVKLKGQLDCKFINEASIEMSEICEKMISFFGGFTIHRSFDYIHWRFFLNPFAKPKIVGAYNKDKLVGYIVFGTNKNVSAIVDIVIDPTDEFKPSEIISTLVRFAEEDLTQENSSLIRTWYMGGHPLSSLIKKALLREGWIYSKKGFDMVMKDQSLQNIKDTSIENIYVSRTFSQGSIF